MKYSGNRIFVVGGLALALTLTGLQTVSAAGQVQDDELKQFNTCLAMSSEALVSDTDCLDMMKQRRLSAADMQTIKTCKAMKADLMSKDETCIGIAKAHPDIMRPTPQ